MINTYLITVIQETTTHINIEASSQEEAKKLIQHQQGEIIESHTRNRIESVRTIEV